LEAATVPKLTHKPPKLTHHVPSGQARARYQGKDYYFGSYGSAKSYQRYAEFLSRWSSGALAPATAEVKPPPAVRTPLVMAELVERFDAHCDAYYRRDGEPTSERITFRSALRPVLTLFRALSVAEFSPKRLVAVRDEMIRLKWSRRYINASVRRIRQMFRWAVAEELVSPTIASALAAVEPLKEGRSEAREKDLPGPVDDAIVAATICRIKSPVVVDVIRLMQHSGMRPAEAIGMRVEAIDRSDPECWHYIPRRHKTTHRGKRRTVFLGPKCQAILLPYIIRAGGGRIFRMTSSGLRTAINRGCDRAFRHPTLSSIQPDDMTAAQRAELEAWRKAHRWAPNQLRHLHATVVRKEFGVEGAQVMLGHAHIQTTEIYAEANVERGREVAKKIG
jgi:integrase